MWSALAELDTNEDFWPAIVARISDGEFLATIASDLKVNHSILRNWIRGNKAREKAFADADKQGRQSRIERVMQRTYEAAASKISRKPTRMEQLRAAEIILKQQESDRPATAQFGDITINFVQAQDGKTVEGKVIDSLP